MRGVRREKFGAPRRFPASGASATPKDMARVLLIDDDSELLDLLGEWLSGKGHAVCLLTDGNQAVDTAKAFDPDVILLDGLLRGITGPAVAEKLRGQSRCTIVYVSGLPRSEFPKGSPVIEKPIDLDDLERTIRSVA